MKAVEIIIDGVHHIVVPDNGSYPTCAECSLMMYCTDSDQCLCSYFVDFDSHFEIVK